MNLTRPLAMLIPLLLAGLLLPGLASAAPGLLQPLGQHAFMDWNSMRLSATGQGFPPADQGNPKLAQAMAERAALLDARRNLLEALMAVRVDSTTTVRDFITESDVAVSRVNGVLHRNVTEESRPLEQGYGGVQARVSIPVAGDLAQELFTHLPQADTGTPTTSEAEQSRWEMRAPITSADTPPYTGVIVDARGLGLEPVLRPRLLGPDGLLHPLDVSPEAAAARGFVAYFQSEEQALGSGRVGDAPLLVKAHALDANGDGLLLPDEQAALLRRILELPGNFLHNCAVAVIL
jgi:hypothetical protein